MDRVALLLGQKGNRRLLEDLLATQYQVIHQSEDYHLTEDFDLAVLDALMLQRVRTWAVQRRSAEAPVLLPFLLLAPRQNSAAIARNLGDVCDEMLLMPIDKIELHARVANLLRMRRMSVHLHQQYEAVDRLSVTDDVTGFHNTRFLHRHLDQLLAEPNALVSLVFFDMDGFKKVVDTHGHLLAAKVLRQVAEVVHQHLGEEDRIVRYGGDEYIVILPSQNKEKSLAKVERFKGALTSTPFLHEEGVNARVSASFGLATYPHDASDKRELLAEADRCLFRSKDGGKNRITTASCFKQASIRPVR